MTALLHALTITCAHCHRGVETVVYGPEAQESGVRAYAAFARLHERATGHWPEYTRLNVVHDRIGPDRRG